MPGGYRAIAAVKWTSLGVFPALSRLAYSGKRGEELLVLHWGSALVPEYQSSTIHIALISFGRPPRRFHVCLDGVSAQN